MRTLRSRRSAQGAAGRHFGGGSAASHRGRRRRRADLRTRAGIYAYKGVNAAGKSAIARIQVDAENLAQRRAFALRRDGVFLTEINGERAEARHRGDVGPLLQLDLSSFQRIARLSTSR